MGNFCTSGDVNINGVNGYAPLVKVVTDKNGVFQSGQIFSAIQKDKGGPVLDEKNAAAKEIKQLTESDFPRTPLVINEDGKIERKEKLLGMQETEDKKEMNGEIAETIVDFSKQYLGLPYGWGSEGPEAFDCAGFTSFVFKSFGYGLSSGCVNQIHQGTKVKKEELKTGDLIFFKGKNTRSKRVGHVGIVVANQGNGNITFIHACRRGVIIDNLSSSAYYKPRYVTGLRILEENANT
jgi:cell wall-associated NlpC family hydrolase